MASNTLSYEVVTDESAMFPAVGLSSGFKIEPYITFPDGSTIGPPSGPVTVPSDAIPELFGPPSVTDLTALELNPGGDAITAPTPPRAVPTAAPSSSNVGVNSIFCASPARTDSARVGSKNPSLANPSKKGAAYFALPGILFINPKVALSTTPIPAA